MRTLLGLLILLVAVILGWQLPIVQAETSHPTPTPSLEENLQPIKTESRFSEKLIEISDSIPRKTVYKDDPETEAGEETVLEEGADGKKTKIFKITYYKQNTDTPGVGFDSPGVKQDKEYSRELVSAETTPAKDKKISRGTKIVWRTLQT